MRKFYILLSIVIDPGLTSLSYGQLMNEEEHENAVQEFKVDSFQAQIGAEAIKEMLSNIDLNKEQKI